MLFRFCLAAGLLVALAGCDSNNPGNALRDLDGQYRLDELVFVTDGTGVADADVGARLNLDVTELEIFGDGDARLISRFSAQDFRRSTDLAATASRGRVTLTARTADDQNELDDLLLPSEFSMTYEGSPPNTLTGFVRRTNINLEAFDPEVFRGQTSVSGDLRIRFSRL